MKTRFLFVFLFLSTYSFSQSMIDVIRASNYYSKAMEAYDAEKYSDALAYLKDAEINLKGKTNGDLEFLKIMVRYKLKDYEAAYTSLIQFFNGDYKKNRSFFKNIQPYSNKHSIEYDEYLTKQFIDIENQYNLIKGINKNISAEKLLYDCLPKKEIWFRLCAPTQLQIIFRYVL